MITIDLPWPPSVNHYYIRTRRGMIIGKKGIEYLQEVKRLVANADTTEPTPMRGDLRMTVFAYPPDKRRRDLDNLCKCLWDSLTKSGVYDDDFQIADFRILRCDSEKGGRLTVHIWSKDDDAN